MADRVACDAAFDGVSAVQIVESSYRLDDYFLRRDALVSERVLAITDVVRAGA